ncbi:hypothetical protein COO60DRAFT_1505578 [Scenedesmus sp. NREL 46B-D3]|nr:hypothetical protein COO60DRAFT_1505578 [Scenedesmus sp. NREL 46B-D3]
MRLLFKQLLLGIGWLHIEHLELLSGCWHQQQLLQCICVFAVCCRVMVLGGAAGANVVAAPSRLAVHGAIVVTFVHVVMPSSEGQERGLVSCMLSRAALGAS